ncbi:MAG: histidine phosphatase family protein [Planctomycetota bacterium]|nr:MAG: histidine phosphatase family protein [Planctomycetota bacterium]
MILFLVRHGESQFNAEGRIQGQLDVPLSDLGRRQALAVAERFAAEPLDTIYSSPLSRALDTASEIAARLNIDVRIDERLKEIHAGAFQGLTRREMAERYPDEERRWTAREPDFRVPGGETRRELGRRGRAALEAIRETQLDRVAVVAHGAILSATLKALLDIPVHRAPFHFYNAAVTKILWKHEPIVDTLNETEHLRGLDTRGFGDL